MPLLLIITALFLSVIPLHADTTWVAGEVWGVWGRRGNPYMVTDTLTIPHDYTLQIMPGVQIYFLDQEIRRTPILVYGRLLAIGEEGDSIYMRSPITGFGGISSQYTSGTEICLEYCVIDSMYGEIFSYHGIITLRHSWIKAYSHAIYSFPNIATVQHCYFEDATASFDGGSVVYQYNRGTTNTCFTAYQSQVAPFHDNQLGIVDLDGCSAAEIYNNVLRRGVAFQSGSTHWYNNRIEDTFWQSGGTTIFEHNVVGYIHAQEMSGIIRNNEVYGSITSLGAIRLTSTALTLEENLVVSPNNGIWMMATYPTSGVNVIRGNTIIFDDSGIKALSTMDITYVYDNIFVGDGVNATGVYNLSSYPYSIRYNDFCNVTAVTYGCELDTGNIFLDPLFCGGNPYDYHLQANSPCIDAGDPSSPLDPDSTRADMGCYYFDQLIDQPPAIISPVTVNVQRGQILRYEARATDDHGPLHFGFWNIPGWLHRVYQGMDFEEGIAVLSGRVPYQQQDFTFGVWVEDGAAQRDSQEVDVLISSYTILAGEVTGVLTVEDSPYMVVEDVVVPAGDSLRIEPGVEIRFQWEPVADLRHRIVVRGKLKAIGTQQDTIRFMPEFGDSLLDAWRGIWCIGSPNDTSNFKYSYFLRGIYIIVADSQATLILENSNMVDANGMYIRNTSHAQIDSCQFLVYNPYFNTFVRADSGIAFVTNCHSEFMVPYLMGSHFVFQGCTSAIVQKSSFVGGGFGRSEYGGYLQFIGNRVTQTHSGVYYSNSASGVAANNVFIGDAGIGVFGGDSVLISNNLFFHTNMGVELNPPIEVSIRNNIFIANEIGVETYHSYPPFGNIAYNNFYENDSDFVNCLPDSTNIYLDPIVQDTINFRLSLGSPCIDAGDPDPFFNDVDSTRNDIGCWGGPWGESYPYPTLFVHQSKPLPTDFALLPPYPNPFNSVLVIPFTLPVEKEVIINIYNILGQKVQEFSFPPLSPGVHRVVWNSGSCASGLYIIQLISGGKEFNQKVLLLK